MGEKNVSMHASDAMERRDPVFANSPAAAAPPAHNVLPSSFPPFVRLDFLLYPSPSLTQQDIFTLDQIISDSYGPTEVDSVVYEAGCQMIPVGEVDGGIKVVDVVRSFRLT
jgi:hypothetical protein